VRSVSVARHLRKIRISPPLYERLTEHLAAGWVRLHGVNDGKGKFPFFEIFSESLARGILNAAGSNGIKIR
jgi:hypothetical protein